MMVVVTYDIDTTTPAGEKRLRKVAKACEAYGVRVQASVFEVVVEPAQLVRLQCWLREAIDEQTDSVRFYRLGSNWRPRIDSIGKPPRLEQDGVLLI